MKKAIDGATKNNVENISPHVFKTLTTESIRIPIINYENTKSKIKIDICVNNILGYLNSKMLKIYSSIDPIVMKMGIIVKMWAKEHDLINKDMMTSYAFILLLIYFL